MEPEIQRLAIADEKDALEFCRAIYAEMGWPQDKLGRSIAEIFCEAGDIFLSAKYKGEIIGTAGILRLSETQALLKRFYIKEEWRGTTLAHRLFDTLIEQARWQGYSTLFTDVGATNTRAVRFYQRAGMEEVFAPESHPRWEGSSLARQKTDRYFRLFL